MRVVATHLDHSLCTPPLAATLHRGDRAPRWRKVGRTRSPGPIWVSELGGDSHRSNSATAEGCRGSGYAGRDVHRAVTPLQQQFDKMVKEQYTRGGEAFGRVAPGCARSRMSGEAKEGDTCRAPEVEP